MDLEWDSVKSQRNFTERGFGFDAAVLIFAGPVIEWRDVRHAWGEARVVAVGAVENVMLAVVYTDRGDVRRIISARRAREKEIELWQWYVNL